MQDDFDEELCKACLDAPLEIMVYPCGHLFYCARCAEQWFMRCGADSVTCPACRAAVTAVYQAKRLTFDPGRGRLVPHSLPAC